MLKVTITILIALLILLQYKLWVEDNSIIDMWKLENQVALHQENIAKLTHRNKVLEAEVNDLKSGNNAIEERARNEVDMIKKGEVYYRIVPLKPNSTGKSS